MRGATAVAKELGEAFDWQSKCGWWKVDHLKGKNGGCLNL